MPSSIPALTRAKSFIRKTSTKGTERLDVTREQLRVAIRHVGFKVDDVARFLGNPDVRGGASFHVCRVR